MPKNNTRSVIASVLADSLSSTAQVRFLFHADNVFLFRRRFNWKASMEDWISDDVIFT